jgi:diguanylate cyclase (GGDEF)-like protein/putative nucleotidyltransferase with HDIG domain
VKRSARDRLDRAIEALGPLPVLGGTVARVRALAADPDASTQTLVAVIEEDESFSANLLRYANSAAYARPLRARTIHQAVTVVGRQALGRIALEASTYSFLERVPGAGGRSRGHMHVHAVGVAACAAELAQRTGADVETAHLAGLLHDVGKLVMPIAFGEGTMDAIVGATPSGALRVIVERERLGVDHAYAGALLADRDGEHGGLFDAVVNHHGGASGVETPSREAACVQLANSIVAMLAGDEADSELIHAALNHLDAVPSLLDEAAEAAVASQVAPAESGDALADRVAALERLASTDELTGLASRREWLSSTRARLAEGAAGTVLMCDVDHFKQINDSVGHLTADLVLTEIALVLRANGAAGRLGGDEFALWVPGGLAEAQRVADGVVAEVQARLSGSGDLPAVTLSVGAASTASCGHDLTRLLEAADRALYDAKTAGRSRAAFGAA